MRKIFFLSSLLLISIGVFACGDSSPIAEVSEVVAAQEIAAAPAPAPTLTPAPTPAPTPTPTPTPEPEPPEIPRAGSYITLADIEWRVLDAQDNYVLVISSYVLTQGAFHDTQTAVSWEASTIRAFLNDDFLEAFSEAELEMISYTEVSTYDNHWFGTPGGEPAVDRVFLLSLEEVVKHFGDSGRFADQFHPQNGRIVVDDEYTPAREAFDLATGYGWMWWLRSMGSNDGMAAIIGNCGRLGVGGVAVSRYYVGIRPAMWIDFYLFYEYLNS